MWSRFLTGIFRASSPPNLRVEISEIVRDAEDHCSKDAGKQIETAQTYMTISVDATKLLEAGKDWPRS